MAGSIVVTTSELGGGVSKYSVAWTSDALGAVSGNSFAMKRGSIVSVEFMPGTGGTQPSDLYDVTCTDAEGANILDDGTGTGSVGTNLSNVNSVYRCPFIGGSTVSYVRMWLHGGTYTPVVAAAGASKTGTIVFYVSDVIL